MSNEELVKLVQEGQDPDGCYIMQLWRQNHGLIWQSVKIYTKFDNEEDLMQEAFIGLRKAVDFYDPNMNTKFATYLTFWIKQIVSRYIRNNGKLIRMPVHCYDLLYKRKRFISEYRGQFGQDPSDQQIAAELDISINRLKALEQRTSRCNNIRSLYDPIGNESSDLKLEDCLSDGSIPQEEIDEQIYREQRAAAVWKEVNELPDKQKSVILMRYLEDKTLDECAKEIGVTEELVRRRQIAAVKTLGSGKHRKMLIIYADNNPYNSALHGSVSEFKTTHTSSTEKIAIRNVERHRTAMERIAAFISNSEEENE